MSLNIRALMGSVAKVVDPYFNRVAMLLSGDGSNGTQNNTFVDSSPNNFSITRSGNATQGSFSPYGTRWSNYFDGTTSQSLSVANNAALDLPSNTSFTIEGWIYPIRPNNGAQSGFRNVVSKRVANSLTSNYNIMLWFNSEKLGFYNGSTSSLSAGSITLNTWTHFAYVYNGATSLQLYINGVLDSTFAVAPGATNSAPVTIGSLVDDTGTNDNFGGYISNIRIVKGSQVYTSNFTPPTAPLTAITNTSLLTCQDNRFRDASTNNFAIARNGDVKVTPFSPYAPASTYNGSVNGGSAFFDGVGDYLALPTAAGVIGTGDFTVEAWYKSNVSTAPTHCPIIANYEANSNGSWAVKASAGSNQCLEFAYYDNGWNDLTTSVNITADMAWHHVAVTRSGSTLRIYADGVLINSWTVTTSLGGNGYTVQVGRIANDDAYTNGWIADARLVTGTALYTGSTYTVPTAPLTAISGTKFLVGGRNAGIVDSSGKNNLETLGNVQISTTTKKYGTGSIYFDGDTDWIEHGVKSDWTWLHHGLTDWTIEGWLYPSDVSGKGLICTNTNSLNGAYGTVMGIGILGGAGCIGGHFTRGVDGARMDWYTADNVIATNQWSHVAVMFNSTTKNISVAVNGTLVSVTNQNVVGNSPTGQDGSAFAYSSVEPSFNLNIGRLRGGVTIGGYYTGYVDDLRITRGLRRYTANFTPPDKSLPVQ